MNPRLQALFDTHASAVFDKQSALNDRVGRLDWNFDTGTGILRFGDKYQWKAQVLGTESGVSGTWLWAWGNKASHIPENLLEASRSLRQLGADNGISELSSPQIRLDDGFGGHFWAILATGLCKANAYFRGPYKGGAAFLLIKDADYPEEAGDPLGRLRSMFPQAVCAYNIGDHRRALLGHAESLGLPVQSQADCVSIKDGAGNCLVAKFDDAARLTEITGKIVKPCQAGPATSEKPAKATFLEAWLKNCRTHYKGAALLYGTISAAVGLVAWIFTSPATAAIIASVVFVILWITGFIEYDE